LIICALNTEEKNRLRSWIRWNKK